MIGQLHTLAVAGAALLLAFAPAVARAQRPSPNLREVWSVYTDSMLFTAPRSIVVTAGCTVWIADPRSGLWRLPCMTGGVPTRVAPAVPPAVAAAADSVAAVVPVVADSLIAWLVSPARGDTIALWDRARGRRSLFASGDSAIRTQTLSLPEMTVGHASGFSPELGDSSLRVWTVKYSAAGSARTDRSYVFALAANGAVRDSLAAKPGVQSATDEMGPGSLRIPAPHQRKPFVSFFRDGRFLTGANDDAHLDLHDSTGKHARTITLPLPEAGRVTRADRDAYADSVRRSTEREMALLRYDDSLLVRVRGEIDRVLKADGTFPAFRQRYDHLALDDKEETAWVLLPGIGEAYARTWFICSLTEMSFCRTQTVPHQGAVVAVSIRGGAIYAIEHAMDGAMRVAKYAAQ